MKVRGTFEVLPSAPFGTPEEGTTVLPSGPGQFAGDVFHRSLVKVGHGVLSQYRKDGDALQTSVSVAGTEIRFRDNYADVLVEVAEPGKAYSAAATAIDLLLQHLSVSQRRAFSARPLVLETEDGAPLPIPRSVRMASICQYNVARLKGHIELSATACTLSDDRLQRALSYYEHALMLFDARSRLVDPQSRYQKQLISSALLNLWKAATSIIGDPSRRSDQYQRRYRSIGLPSSFKAKLDELKALRDDYDVAHYSLSAESLEALERKAGFAIGVASEVILQYCDHLRTTIDRGGAHNPAAAPAATQRRR
jgi:hypothetical protein